MKGFFNMKFFVQGVLIASMVGTAVMASDFSGYDSDSAPVRQANEIAVVLFPVASSSVSDDSDKENFNPSNLSNAPVKAPRSRKN
jgi:hypothetical protein